MQARAALSWIRGVTGWISQTAQRSALHRLASTSSAPDMGSRSGTLLDAFGRRGDVPALLSQKSGSSLSFDALRQLVVQTANTLHASGIQPGNVVTIADANTVRSP